MSGEKLYTVVTTVCLKNQQSGTVSFHQ